MRNVTHKVTTHPFCFYYLGDIPEKYQAVTPAEVGHFYSQVAFGTFTQLRLQRHTKLSPTKIVVELGVPYQIQQWLALVPRILQAQQALRRLIHSMAPSASTITTPSRIDMKESRR